MGGMILRVDAFNCPIYGLLSPSKCMNCKHMMGAIYNEGEEVADQIECELEVT